ncbi:MAG: exonuclease domain-containing protein [Eubacterium sp.]|nr:exonuclease domain-containing protein [Eubacterium sp.]
MSSKLSYFKKIQNNPLEVIIEKMAAAGVSEAELLSLMIMWISQGNLPPKHPVFSQLKKRQEESRKNARKNKNEEQLLLYLKLRREGWHKKALCQALDCSEATLTGFMKKWYARLKAQGLSDADIAKSLCASRREISPIAEAYKERELLKLRAERRALQENKRYAKKHLRQIQAELSGHADSRYFIFDTEAVQCPDELIEISIIDCFGKTVYDSLVRPTHKINWRISALTGITNQMVAHQPDIRQVMTELKPLLSGKTLMSWGINYDASLIKASMKRTGIFFSCGFCCAQKIHMGLTDSLQQMSLKKAAGRDNQNHRALDDCRMVLDVLRQDVSAFDTTFSPVQFTEPGLTPVCAAP